MGMKPKVHNSHLSKEILEKSNEIAPLIENEMALFSIKAFDIKPKIERYSETVWYCYKPSWHTTPYDLLMEIALEDSRYGMSYYGGLPPGLCLIINFYHRCEEVPDDIERQEISEDLVKTLFFHTDINCGI